MLAKGDHVIPIPGASRPSSAIDSARAVDLKLDDEEIIRLDRDERSA
jgi:aryl-alcohol dehydrogenase-like predicted oxidoreductase